jgi:hypothetical protein
MRRAGWRHRDSDSLFLSIVITYKERHRVSGKKSAQTRNHLLFVFVWLSQARSEYDFRVFFSFEGKSIPINRDLSLTMVIDGTDGGEARPNMALC